jgi:hypothetical protein
MSKIGRKISILNLQEKDDLMVDFLDEDMFNTSTAADHHRMQNNYHSRKQIKSKVFLKN